MKPQKQLDANPELNVVTLYVVEEGWVVSVVSGKVVLDAVDSRVSKEQT